MGSSVDSLWSQVRAGRHVAAIGAVPFPLAGARGITVVRASCEGGANVVDEARNAIRKLLGIEPDGGRAAPVASAGRALLDEGEEPESISDLVVLCNDLADASDGRAALVVDAVDAASPATVEALGSVLADGGLRLPLVLTWHAPPDETTAPLIDAIRLASGDQAVAQIGPPERSAFDWATLPSDALAIVRAASIVGTRFDAGTVGALLDVPVHRVLAGIQRAVDAGASIADEGAGVFVLPRSAVPAIRERILPSWAAHLHARLAERDRPDAGRHLVMAGDRSAAIERFLDGAAALSERGDVARALANVDEALALVADQPKSPRTRLLRARVHLEAARAKWTGAGTDPAITLSDALASIEAAARALPPDPPAPLFADLASVLAAIAYDIGESPLVGHAIEQLQRATAGMMRAGDAVRAARLSNDEAALHMRFGATARAAELLARAGELLGAARDEDPAALRELAVNEHLRARLPLHDERGARSLVAEALEHARAAERIYVELGQKRGAARVLETMGRLELLAGTPAEAERHVLQALRIEETIGDATGLARGTAALAEILARQGKMDEAVQLIESSASLNLRRGAASALAFNRRAVARLRATGRPSAVVETKLRALEDALSRAPLAVSEDTDPGLDGVRLPSAS